MRKTSCGGLKFLFWLALGLACFSIGFLLATGFLRAVTVSTSSIALPLEDNRWVSFYDQQRKEITKVFVRVQNPIQVSQMPTLLQRAFVQKKDPQFYNHSIRFSDLFPIFITELKVFFGLEKPVRYYRGITQTIAYNLFLIRRKALPHRLDEAILAYTIQRQYRKEEILEYYLNNIYFGAGAFGVEAASNYYFRKHTANLRPQEIAFLIFLATDTLSPDIYRKEHSLPNLTIVKAGRDQVLDEMASWGLITPKQAGEFKRKALGIVSY